MIESSWVIFMKYRFFAINPSFQPILKGRESTFEKLLEHCDETQLSQLLASFDEQDIYRGCVSLLEDDTIDLHDHDITMYRRIRDEFFHMRIFPYYIEMNDYETSPFYHYLMRLHKEYLVIDEFAHVHYQKYCKNY